MVIVVALFVDTSTNMKRRYSSPFRNTKTRPSCPEYKIVKGTKFAVDAFSYGDLRNVNVYFLTHFHSDHYGGLNSSFKHPIYCSKITGDFCREVLRIKPSNIKILVVNKTCEIDGVRVTAIDANHCPGAVMLLFNLKNGQNILHCGDFRANNVMESHPLLKNKQIHVVYLDTTYCNPKYDFPSQEKSIEMALSILKNKEKAVIENGRDFLRILIVCGTYTIGKENFFLGLAEKLNYQIWTTPDKNSLLKIGINKDFNKNPPHLCRLHVLSMMNLNYNYLSDHLNKFNKYFDEIIAFKPTGWEYSKSVFEQRDNITIFGVPYSEHSSFSELQKFIKFCKPTSVIPTVPGLSNAKIQKYFSCWIGSEKNNSQTKISDYFKIVTAKNTKI